MYSTQHSHKITTTSTWSHTTAAPYTISTTSTPIITSIEKIPPKKTPLQPPPVPSAWNFFLLSNSPLSRLFARSRSLNRIPDNNSQQESTRPQSFQARPKARSASSKEGSQELLGVTLCSGEVKDLSADFQIHRALKPLLNFKQRH